MTGAGGVNIWFGCLIELKTQGSYVPQQSPSPPPQHPKIIGCNCTQTWFHSSPLPPPSDCPLSRAEQLQKGHWSHQKHSGIQCLSRFLDQIMQQCYFLRYWTDFTIVRFFKIVIPDWPNDGKAGIWMAFRCLKNSTSKNQWCYDDASPFHASL